MKTEGIFDIYYKNGYAWLTVYPRDDSRAVYPEDITGRLNLLGINGIRRQVIIDIIEAGDGVPHPLTQWPEGRHLAPVITVEKADDMMTGWLSVKAGRQGGEPLSIDMLRTALKESGVVCGIDDEVLQTIAFRGIYDQKIAVAHGTEAVDEKAAEPEYFFVTDRLKPFRELEYHRMDLKELNFIQNKMAGDMLAVLGAPVTAAEGRDIAGNILEPERGAVAESFCAGDGALLTEDGKSITAAIDGNVRLSDGTVIVDKLISVENVDYSNGNMDFNGSIDINGRIADGFTVKAAGDVQIGKSLSRVDISCEGDLILKAGISGNDEGKIYCGGNLYAKYIENANVTCRGNIVVEEAIMHSRIKADGDILLTGKRAEVFGGRICAGGNIKCKKLGSINEPVTEVFPGMDIEKFSLLEEHQDAVSSMNKRLNELDTTLRQLKNAMAKVENQEEQRQKVLTAIDQLTGESEEINSKLSAELRELHELKKDLTTNESSSVAVDQMIFGKVYVFFGSLRWDSPTKGTSKTDLYVKNEKIIER